MLSCITVFPECPHCGNENVTFYLENFDNSIVHEKPVWTVWACSICGKGVCGESLSSPSGRKFDYSLFTATYPKVKSIEAPEGTPPEISATYITAVRNFRRGRDADFDAACIMARKSIELAVNQFRAQGKNLKQRIDDLKEKRIISPAMKSWAHEIRIIGNESAHDGINGRLDAEQAVYFAEMLFTYLYKLPAMLNKRRQKDI